MFFSEIKSVRKKTVRSLSPSKPQSLKMVVISFFWVLLETFFTNKRKIKIFPPFFIQMFTCYTILSFISFNIKS